MQKWGQNTEQVHDLRNSQRHPPTLLNVYSSFLLANYTLKNNDIKGTARVKGLYKIYKYNICGSTYYTYQILFGCCSWETFTVDNEGICTSALVRKMTFGYWWLLPALTMNLTAVSRGSRAIRTSCNEVFYGFIGAIEEKFKNNTILLISG